MSNVLNNFTEDNFALLREGIFEHESHTTEYRTSSSKEGVAALPNDGSPV